MGKFWSPHPPCLLPYAYSPVPTYIMTLSLLAVLPVPVPSSLKLPWLSWTLILFHTNASTSYSQQWSPLSVISMWPGTPQWFHMVKDLPAMQELQEMRVSIPGSGKTAKWEWQPTPVFLPAESHGQGAVRLQSVESQTKWLITSSIWANSWNAFIFLKISSVFLSTCLSPFCFRTQGFYNISDQWLHHIVHILSVGPPVFAESPSFPPFHLFSPFAHLDFLDLLLSTPHILTLLSTLLLAKTVFWKLMSVCSHQPDGLCNHLLSSPTLQPFPHPCFWKLMKASSSVGAYYQLPTLLH